MPKGFDEWYSEQKTPCWLCTRPQLRAEVAAACDKAGPTAVYRWLVAEYGYEHSRWLLRKCLAEHGGQSG